MASRLLSYSELQTAFTCQARWDFAYGGRLAGSTLKARTIAPILSDGRAWGAAVATWHQHGGELFAHGDAVLALGQSYEADYQAMIEAGGWTPLDAVHDQRLRLEAMLTHHVGLFTPLPNLSMLEEQIIVSIPSRTGKRSSSKYKYLAMIDGFTTDEHGDWIVEFKLRKSLTPFKYSQLSRQLRWYVWAYQRMTGRKVAGVLLEERLNEVPKLPRILKSGKVSHAKDQMCTIDAYTAACLATGEEINFETLTALGERRWGQRHWVQLTQQEIEEAGQELISAAQYIGWLDDGTLHPVRNASMMTCRGCRFVDICPHPTDEIVDELFTRGEAKRLRPPYEKKEIAA
jgi:hypothetical protein